MNQQKPHSLRRYGICLAVLCLCGCLILSVGVTFARYRTEYLAETYKFEAYNPQSYLLHGEVVTEEQLAAAAEGQWPDYPLAWSMYSVSTAPIIILVEGDAEAGEDDLVFQPTAQLRFSVSNGVSKVDYTKRDQLISLQMVAPLTVGDPQELRVILSGPDLLEPEKVAHYTAVPEPIVAGSYLYETYGDGWVYRFYEEDGRTPVTFPLSGEGLDFTNFALSVKGDVWASLLSLEIAGVYN